MGRPWGRARSRAHPETQLAAAPPFPHFHMTLSSDDQFGQQRRFWCYHPYGTGLARPGCGGPGAPRDSGCGGDPTGDAAQSWRPRGWRRRHRPLDPHHPRVCLTTLVCRVQATWVSRHESSPGPRRARDGRRCHARPPSGPPATTGLDRDRRPRDPAGRAAGHGPARPGHIVKVDASHLSMSSHPAVVTRLIVAAAAAPAEGQGRHGGRDLEGA